MSHKVTPKQAKAVYLLARGNSVAEVSRQLKLRRETLSRWKQRPEFTAEFERVMTEMREQMQHRLANLIDESIYAASWGMLDRSDPQCAQIALGVLKMIGIHRILLPEISETERK